MRKVWRLVVATCRRFYDDHCFMRASALAYASLLSLVPLLAVMFSVLKGLGVQRRLEPLLLARFSLHPETTATILGYIDRTNFRTLGAFGGVVLVMTIYSLLSGVEASFNHIWRVRRGRLLAQRLPHYFGVVLLTPFLLLTAVAITSSYQVEHLVRWARGSEILGDAVVGLLGSLPIAMNIVALAILYAVMPNRRPYWPSVVLGAVAAGIGWHLVQVGYLRLQFGVARYNAIYGALSQLPVTLVWQYVSWVVVLAGAELAAVYELGTNPRRHEDSQPTPFVIALDILVRAARSFEAAAAPVRASAIARDLRTSPESVSRAMSTLVDQGWLAAVHDGMDEHVLAASSRQIGLAEIAAAFEGEVTVPIACSPETREWLTRLAAAKQEAWACWTLADVVRECLQDTCGKPVQEPVQVKER